MARLYAKVVGAVVLVLGIVGLLAGNEDLLGVINIDVVEDLVHVASGGLLLYAGYKLAAPAVKSIVGAVGVVYLLVGVVGFVAPELGGLLPHAYSVVDNIIHLTLGILGIAVAATQQVDDTARA
jgi:hypothetical protein